MYYTSESTGKLPHFTASYFSMQELLPLLMSIPVKFLMAISGESVDEAMEATLETIERDLRAAKVDL